MKVSRARGFVALFLAVVLVVLAQVFDTGTGTLSALGVGWIASVCPVGALESFLGAREVGVHALICLAIAAAVVLAVGKAFCSWACPVPWLQRFFRSGKHRSRRSPDAEAMQQLDENNAVGQADGDDVGALESIGGERDGLQVDSRHIVLGGALLSSLAFGFPVFCLVCPVGLSFATLIAVWNLFRFGETTLGVIAFPAVLVLEVVFLRKWCFKFCPISALTSLISRGNVTLRPRVEEGSCLRGKGMDCRVCVESCSERVDPHSQVIPECSKCHVCAEKCPAKAITFPILPSK